MTDNDTSGELYITCTSRGKRTVRISIYLCSQSGYPPVKHHSYTYNNITYKPTKNYKMADDRVNIMRGYKASILPSPFPYLDPC